MPIDVTPEQPKSALRIVTAYIEERMAAAQEVNLDDLLDEAEAIYNFKEQAFAAACVSDTWQLIRQHIQSEVVGDNRAVRASQRQEFNGAITGTADTLLAKMPLRRLPPVDPSFIQSKYKHDAAFAAMLALVPRDKTGRIHIRKWAQFKEHVGRGTYKSLLLMTREELLAAAAIRANSAARDMVQAATYRQLAEAMTDGQTVAERYGDDALEVIDAVYRHTAGM